MPTVPETSSTMLRDIGTNTDSAAWSDFVACYRPVMEAHLKARFPMLDADDLIQETLLALVQALPTYRYSPSENGSFRNYLTGILRHKALRSVRKGSRTVLVPDQAGVLAGPLPRLLRTMTWTLSSSLNSV